MIVSELAELVYKTRACQCGMDFTMSDILNELPSHPKARLKMALGHLAAEGRLYSDYRDNRRKYLKADRHPLNGQKLAYYEPPVSAGKKHLSKWLTRERYE